jgi:ribonuclease HII
MLQPFLHTDQKFLEIGIDEAGRGPLFGRLYTAGVVLPKTTGVVLPKTTEPKTTIDLGLPKSTSTDEKKTKEINWTCIKDSKKIKSHKKIKACAEFIKENALAYSVQFVEHTTIDQINIRQAVFRGMHACIHEIREKLDQTKHSLESEEGNTPNPNSFFLLIDGNDFKPYAMFDETTQKLEYLPYQTIEKGDNTYLAIAAASILAKCARDEYMLELCEQRPELKEKYGMHTNMGYGTKKHIEGIKQYGLVEGHRLSFHIK